MLLDYQVFFILALGDAGCPMRMQTSLQQCWFCNGGYVIDDTFCYGCPLNLSRRFLLVHVMMVYCVKFRWKLAIGLMCLDKCNGRNAI